MGAAARRGRLTDTEAISFSLLLLLARSATQTKFFSFSVRSTPAKRSFAPAQPLVPNLSPFPFTLSLHQRRYAFLFTVHCSLSTAAHCPLFTK